jgi:hypothetical protein
MFILGIAAWIFLLLVALAIGIIVAVEKEEPWGAFIAIVAAGVVAHYTGTLNMIDALHNWQHLLGFFGAYLAVGAGWCYIKWGFYTTAWGREHRERIQTVRAEFLKLLGLKGDSVPAEHKAAWEQWQKQDSRHGYSEDWSGIYSNLRSAHPSTAIKINPDEIHVKNNWSKFSIWGLYWPFSMLWTLIDDPIKRIFKFIIMNVLGGSLQMFANRANKGIANELSK